MQITLGVDVHVRTDVEGTGTRHRCAGQKCEQLCLSVHLVTPVLRCSGKKKINPSIWHVLRHAERRTNEGSTWILNHDYQRYSSTDATTTIPEHYYINSLLEVRTANWRTINPSDRGCIFGAQVLAGVPGKRLIPDAGERGRGDRESPRNQTAWLILRLNTSGGRTSAACKSCSKWPLTIAGNSFVIPQIKHPNFSIRQVLKSTTWFEVKFNFLRKLIS